MALTDDVGQGLGMFSTMATGKIGVGKATLIGVQEHNVKAGTMDKSPILEAQIKPRAMPGETIGVLVIKQATSNFALVTKRHKLLTKPGLDQTM